MRTILSIFALSMFLSCQEDTSSGFRQCGRMILSDALPVQFWLSECDTFNEHEAGGVHHVCWCQPWNCDDEIVVQFQDTTGQTFYIVAVDEEGSILYQSLISEVYTGVYQTSITPADQSICDEVIGLKILDNTVPIMLAPSAWTDGASDVYDTKNATQFIKSFASLFLQADAYMLLSLISGDIVSFDYTVTAGTYASGTIIVEPILTDSSGAPISYTVLEGGGATNTTFTSGPETRNIAYKVRANATAARLYMRVLNPGFTSGAFNFTITVTPGQILAVTQSNTVAKSDCLEIAESHDETIFIEYSNNKNYAGLVYDNDSPDTTFGIRVPCRFFHEVEKEEDEGMELTASVIITSSQVITQRLLEVHHVPYYFHKKLRRVLKHQTVTIFDKQWKKEEKYEVIEGKGTWPLKAATCLLTDKDSVVRNVS